MSLPLAFKLTLGQRHEMSASERTLEALGLADLRGRPRTRPKYLAGDKACSYRPVYAHPHRRRIRPVIPTRDYNQMQVTKVGLSTWWAAEEAVAPWHLSNPSMLGLDHFCALGPAKFQ